MLRRVVTQHVDEVVDEAFGLLDTLTAAYEDIVSQLGEHELHTSDVQQQLVMKQEVPPEQQDWSSSLDQEDPEPPNIKEEQEDQENPEPPHIKEEQEDQENPEPPNIKEEQEDQEDPEPPHIKEEQEEQEDQEDPEPPHIKEEQDELRISQEGEQLQKLEEAGIKFSFTPVKSQYDDEEAQLSKSIKTDKREAEHLKTEADGEEVRSRSDPESPLQPTADETSQSSECETDNSEDWKETQEPQSRLNPLESNEVPVGDMDCGTGNASISSSQYAGSFGQKRHPKRHSGATTGVTSSSVCGEMLRRVVTQHVDEVVDEAFGLLDTLTAAYEDIVSQLGEHELHTSGRNFKHLTVLESNW
ncbi:cilia- and flagella-associated protein 251-like [Pseudoliparis swirei]|uniref:cilia- and flagella-associated protein 251-like n=1 Tax=Pseudoliparis swirei TaxID=2059687 RepID=UPI0024BD7620|nr:cilia- and flagella-associated protein 251-like [Pseudoliparis swirei]